MKLKYAIATMLLAGSSSGTTSTSASDQPCPCWTPSDLNAVTADNFFPSCFFDQEGELDLFGDVPGKETHSFEVWGRWSKGCLSNKPGDTGHSLSEEQYESCVQQIKKRCAEIGHAVSSVASANQGEMTTFEQQVSVAQGKSKNTMASNSSSALSLLLPGAVVTVATYLITMVI